MSTPWVIAMLLTLISSAAAAQSLEGADVSAAGAEARLGWGGGYSSGAWSLLHLRVTGAGAYTLTLESQTGTLRAGLHPLSATLNVSAGSGVREQRLWLPLFTKRPVKLTLTSSFGTTSATVQPLNADAIVNEPMDSPAAYLGKPRITGSLEPQSALIALAGGAVLTNFTGLERLPSASLGLGELRRDDSGQPVSRLIDFDRIAASVVRVAQPPLRQSEGLAWWCATAFVAALGMYSARRLEWRFTAWSAGLMLGVGLVGWGALQARAESAATEQTVLIGAGGWGLQLRISSRFNPTAAGLSLPSGVRLLSPIKTLYTPSATLIQADAWTSVSYWSAPSTARVPLTVTKNRLENSASEPLTDVYVIGTGPLEPIKAAAQRSFKTTSATGFEDRSSSYGSLVRHLPVGSALARRGQTLVIALPERDGQR